MFRQRPLPPGLGNQLGQQRSGQRILVQDSFISQSMGGRFLEFLVRKILPNGQRTTLPTLHPDEFRKLSTPYNQWAPAPFNSNENPAEAGSIRFVFALSGMEDMFDFEALLSGDLSLQMTSIDHEAHFGKTRVWDGFAPISDRRWREKGFDKLENLEQAMQCVFLAIEAFEYYGHPLPQRKMRDLYNKAYDHLAHFDRVLDAHYRATGTRGGRPTAKVANLWAEFFFTHAVFVTERMHAWVTNHARPLMDSLLVRVRQSSPLPGSGGRSYSPEQMAMLDQVHLLNEAMCRADVGIFVSLEGFKNELPQWRHLTNPPVTNWTNYNGSTSLIGLYPANVDIRLGVFSKRLKWVSRMAIVNALMDNNEAIQSGRLNPCDPEAVHKLCSDQVKEHDEARKELRGTERMPIRQEVWVTYLKNMFEPLPPVRDGLPPRPPLYTRWGYVAYRLYYGQSAEEWTAFTEAFKNDVVRWGEGVAGAADIKPKARIKWIDGREIGIAEGDINAAQRHFHTFTQENGGGLDSDFKTVDAFLVADKSCIESYVKFSTQGPLLPGQNIVDEVDLQPFILVAKALNPDGERPPRDDSSPGFDDTVRVLGSVIFDDVWANLVIRSNTLSSYWPIAAAHPAFVYTGPVMHYQKQGWKQMDRLKMNLMEKADEWKRGGRLGAST
ncbi:hypothetical protein QBC44DRAFT_375982 [Cladorrhinum sp. PSN332]|nr:hypothetical protein QBC44DRAFT_375982 [Cladorrhinum sp. PSN332]